MTLTLNKLKQLVSCILVVMVILSALPSTKGQFTLEASNIKANNTITKKRAGLKVLRPQTRAIVFPETIANVFPDPALSTYVVSYMGKANVNEMVTEAELASLTTPFLAESLGIINIEGLQYLTGVTDLRLTDNQITDITPLATLVNLEILYLRTNEVSDLTALQNLTALDILTLNENQITDISPLVNLSVLTQLDLSSNNISDISTLQFLTVLYLVDISHNNVSDISYLQYLTVVQVVRMSDNQISVLTPLENLTTLFDVDVSNNQVSDLTPLQNLVNLTWLVAGGNLITDITPIQNMTQLQVLRLGNNTISDISALTNMTKLEILILANNIIEDITVLQDKTDLFGLYLNGNKVSDLSAIQNLTNLRFLNLSNNHIEDLTPLVNIIGLIEFDIANQVITKPSQEIIRTFATTSEVKAVNGAIIAPSLSTGIINGDDVSWSNITPVTTLLTFDFSTSITLGTVTTSFNGTVEHPVVVSNKPPVISVPVFSELAVGNSFDPSLGVSATDFEEGALTSSIIVTGAVDVNKPGIYKLTYTVSDLDLNTTNATQHVLVNDGHFVYDNGYIITAKDFKVKEKDAKISESQMKQLGQVNVFDIQSDSWLGIDNIMVDMQNYQPAEGTYSISFTYNPSININVTVEADPSLPNTGSRDLTALFALAVILVGIHFITRKKEA